MKEAANRGGLSSYTGAYLGPSLRQFDALQLLIFFARWPPVVEQVF